MRDTSHKKTFSNSVWGHKEDWPIEIHDMLDWADEISDEIKDMEKIVARRSSFRDAVVNAAHQEAKIWFEEQAVELITNG